MTILAFESVDVLYDRSNKSPRAVLSCGTVNYAVRGGSNVCIFGMTIQMKAHEQEVKELNNFLTRWIAVALTLL